MNETTDPITRRSESPDSDNHTAYRYLLFCEASVGMRTSRPTGIAMQGESIPINEDMGARVCIN